MRAVLFRMTCRETLQGGKHFKKEAKEERSSLRGDGMESRRGTRSWVSKRGASSCLLISSIQHPFSSCPGACSPGRPRPLRRRGDPPRLSDPSSFYSQPCWQQRMNT